MVSTANTVGVYYSSQSVHLIGEGQHTLYELAVQQERSSMKAKRTTNSDAWFYSRKIMIVSAHFTNQRIHLFLKKENISDGRNQNLNLSVTK